MRISVLFLCLLVVPFAACTPAMKVPPPAQSAAAPGKHAVSGTIVSLRKVNMRGSQEPWRAALLTDAAAANSSVPGPLVEFIVRVDDGGTLSIVQMNDPDFHAGDRVLIIRDEQTRLARPG